MDIVNGYFHKFYPKDRYNLEYKALTSSGGLQYQGCRSNTIFPCMVCNDGFSMSVQGHFGAYSFPRDDFADNYVLVEVLSPKEELFENENHPGYEVGDKWIYAYIPIYIVEQVIEKHGGLKE